MTNWTGSEIGPKPTCRLIGIDGNVFTIVGAVSRALIDAGLHAQADEFRRDAFESSSYDAVLRLCAQHVEII